jgi:DNA end-binding protein Ku
VIGDVDARVDERELKMATDLVGSMTAKFNPKLYKDEYRQRLMDLIERKAKGQKIVTQPPSDEKPHRVINLMAALEQSLAEAKKKQGRTSTTTKRRKSA